MATSKKQDRAGFAIPQPTSADLRGRQSVRATFKLTERAIEALSVCAIHLGIKQKSLFDHLIDDMRSLNLIARDLNSTRFGELSRIQKTFVLSRKTLTSLEKAAETFNTPRDALVEYSIQRLLPVIEQERRRHRRRKRLLADIGQHLRGGEDLLQKTREVLGEEDPVYVRLKGAVDGYRSAVGSIGSFVARGEVIEQF